MSYLILRKTSASKNDAKKSTTIIDPPRIEDEVTTIAEAPNFPIDNLVASRFAAKGLPPASISAVARLRTT